MPAAFAGAVAFFAFEAASRVHIERALPGGALDRLRLLLLVVVPAVPVVAFGLAFAHASGADEASGHVRLVAALDNLGKGAGGAAVQNLNIAMGLEESIGLRL